MPARTIVAQKALSLKAAGAVPLPESLAMEAIQAPLGLLGCSKMPARTVVASKALSLKVAGCGPGAGKSGDGGDPGGERVLWGGVIARGSGDGAAGGDQGG